jgi:two-component system response regulator RegA
MEIAGRLNPHRRAEHAGEVAGERAETNGTRWRSADPWRKEQTLPDPRPYDSPVPSDSPRITPASQALLLLIEHTPAMRARLQHALIASGFDVAVAMDTAAALAAAESKELPYAVVEVQFRSRGRLDLVRTLRKRHPQMRIVVITDHDSFATVILALRAGADDYLPMPVSESDLVDALLGRKPALPPIPETPLGAQRICWEHTQRILAQCGHNVSEAARRLRMHRRSLQRLLSKRAPYPRGMLQL